MTTEQFNKKLDEQLSQISDAKFLLTSVTEVHARQVKRIFENGLNANGGKIGSYNSKDPIYVNPLDSPVTFPPKGKTGETTFKSGKGHKTGYFDSYKAFRGAIGRSTSFVNLRLTENLKFDFTNSITRVADGYVTGVRDRIMPEADIPSNDEKTKENVNKVNGIIAKYGAVTFMLSDEEKTIFAESVKLKLLDTLNN